MTIDLTKSVHILGWAISVMSNLLAISCIWDYFAAKWNRDGDPKDGFAFMFLGPFQIIFIVMQLLTSGFWWPIYVLPLIVTVRFIWLMRFNE